MSPTNTDFKVEEILYLIAEGHIILRKNNTNFLVSMLIAILGRALITSPNHLSEWCPSAATNKIFIELCPLTLFNNNWLSSFHVLQHLSRGNTCYRKNGIFNCCILHYSQPRGNRIFLHLLTTSALLFVTCELTTSPSTILPDAKQVQTLLKKDIIGRFLILGKAFWFD